MWHPEDKGGDSTARQPINHKAEDKTGQGAESRAADRAKKIDQSDTCEGHSVNLWYACQKQCSHCCKETNVRLTERNNFTKCMINLESAATKHYLGKELIKDELL